MHLIARHANRGATPEAPLVRFAGRGGRGLRLSATIEYDAVRRAVPRRFSLLRPLPESDRAILVARFVSYRALAFERAKAAPAIVTEAALAIDAPDGSDGMHFYLLSQTANRFDVARRLRDAGAPCEFLDLVAFDDRGNRRGRLLAAGAPWVAATYSACAEASPLRAAKEVARSVLWWTGPRGDGRLTTTSTLSARAAASGEILLAPESALVRLAGREAVPAIGDYFSFEATASIP